MVQGVTWGEPLGLFAPQSSYRTFDDGVFLFGAASSVPDDGVLFLGDYLHLAQARDPIAPIDSLCEAVFAIRVGDY